MFVAEYESKSAKEIESIINRKNPFASKKVVHLNTGEIFDNAKVAAKKFKITNVYKIWNCCHGVQAATNGHRFCYLDDYMKLSEAELSEKLNKKTAFHRIVIRISNGAKSEYTTLVSASRNTSFSIDYIRKLASSHETANDGSIWYWEKDYNKLSLLEKSEILKKSCADDKSRPVICLESKMPFSDIYDAEKKTEISSDEILACCKHFMDNVNGQHFEFVDNFRLMSEVEIQNRLRK